MSSTWAVIVAAGRGDRLGLDRPKAFAKLSGNHSKRNTRLHCDTMRAHRIAVAMLHDLTPELVDHYTGEIARDHAPSTADKHAIMVRMH